MLLKKIDFEFCLGNFRATIIENGFLCQSEIEARLVK